MEESYPMQDKERRMLEKKIIQEVLKGKVTKKEASQAIKFAKLSLDRDLSSGPLIRDLLGLAVHEKTVRRVLVKHQLERVALPPVKPIRRFVAQRLPRDS
jgi:hypothetical protein